MSTISLPEIISDGVVSFGKCTLDHIAKEIWNSVLTDATLVPREALEEFVRVHEDKLLSETNMTNWKIPVVKNWKRIVAVIASATSVIPTKQLPPLPDDFLKSKTGPKPSITLSLPAKIRRIDSDSNDVRDSQEEAIVNNTVEHNTSWYTLIEKARTLTSDRQRLAEQQKYNLEQRQRFTQHLAATEKAIEENYKINSAIEQALETLQKEGKQQIQMFNRIFETTNPT